MEVDRKRYPYEAKTNDPGEKIYYSDLMVMESGAGYYVGREAFCLDKHGGFAEPYSRESGYYHTREDAEEDLRTGTFTVPDGVENAYARSVGNLPSKE